MSKSHVGTFLFRWKRYDNHCTSTDVPHPPLYFTSYRMAVIRKDIDSFQYNRAINAICNIHYISHVDRQVCQCNSLSSHMHIFKSAMTHANNLCNTHWLNDAVVWKKHVFGPHCHHDNTLIQSFGWKKLPSCAAINAICSIHYIYQINNQELECTLIFIINNLNILDALFTCKFSVS